MREIQVGDHIRLKYLYTPEPMLPFPPMVGTLITGTVAIVEQIIQEEDPPRLCYVARMVSNGELKYVYAEMFELVENL